MRSKLRFGDLLGLAEALAARGDDAFALHRHVEAIRPRRAFVSAGHGHRQRADLDRVVLGAVHRDMHHLQPDFGAFESHQRLRQQRIDHLTIGLVSGAHTIAPCCAASRVAAVRRALEIAKMRHTFFSSSRFVKLWMVQDTTGYSAATRQLVALAGLRVELLEIAAEAKDRTITVTQKRARAVDLVVPDRNVAFDALLPAGVGDRGLRPPFPPSSRARPWGG